MTRRRLLGAAGMGGLALLPAPARAEETVDLRYRLPRDITDHRVYFIVRGPQLYVYLISPERRPPDMPGNGPRVYSHLKTTTIYPDQPKQ
jgi:hypothetical protein